jgi:hypothetical protein
MNVFVIAGRSFRLFHPKAPSDPSPRPRASARDLQEIRCIREEMLFDSICRWSCTRNQRLHTVCSMVESRHNESKTEKVEELVKRRVLLIRFWIDKGLHYSTFLLLHLSQACAIRLCALLPTLITFIGSIPGMIAVVGQQNPILPCSSEALTWGQNVGRVEKVFWRSRELAGSVVVRTGRKAQQCLRNRDLKLDR